MAPLRMLCRWLAAAPLLAVPLLGGAIADNAAADQIDLSLNLLYDDPADSNSGGTWQVVAKSDDQGIAQLSFRLTGLRTSSSIFQAPRGVVNGGNTAGFLASVAEFTSSSSTDYTLYRDLSVEPGLETGAFYGVGTLANGAPGDIGPTYSTLSTVLNSPWATGDDLGDTDWDTAAMFFSGVFLPGDQPDFYTDNGPSPIAPQGVVFTDISGATTIVAGVQSDIHNTLVTTTVRTNLEFAPGDYNRDGVVNSVDYAVWREALGTSVVPIGSGPDGQPDGIINQLDFNVWLANYGASTAAPAAPSATSAPSPGSAVLAVLGMICWGARSLRGTRYSAAFSREI